MKNPHENYGHSMTNNILISIYPRYMEKIINKQKNFEFKISILPQLLIISFGFTKQSHQSFKV